MGALSDHSCTKGGPQSNHQILGENGQLNGAAESRIPMLPGYEKLHNPAKSPWKWILFISIIFVASIITAVGIWWWRSGQEGISQHDCLDDWILWDKKCYWLSTRTDKWKQSFDFCNRLGSQLLVIKDEIEKRFIQKTIQGEYRFWIGLIFAGPQMQQIWVDAAQLNQSLFEVFISEGGKNCGVIQADQLRSEMCSDRFKWICERDAVLL